MFIDDIFYCFIFKTSKDFSFFKFLSGKDESERDEDNKTALEKLKDSKQGVVKCRICKEDHWTTMCPYKETLGPLQESLAKGTNEGGEEEKPGGKIK